MRSVAFGVLVVVPLLSQVLGLVVPFADAGLGLDRRNNNVCPRVLKKYEYCGEGSTKCCQPGFGCNTCGEGNVGYTCVERRKDGCKSDHDCYYSQKCIDNGKEPSFCAQLWVDDLPKPGEDKKKKKKHPKVSPSMNPSSLAPSLAPSSMLMAPSLAPSSMIMAPSSMMMAPSSMAMAPRQTRAPAATAKPKPTHRIKRRAQPTKSQFSLRNVISNWTFGLF